MTIVVYHPLAGKSLERNRPTSALGPTSAMPTDAALKVLLNAERRQDGSLLTRAPPAAAAPDCASCSKIGFARGRLVLQQIGKPKISPAPREFLAHTDFRTGLLEIRGWGRSMGYPVGHPKPARSLRPGAAVTNGEPNVDSPARFGTAKRRMGQARETAGPLLARGADRRNQRSQI